jgi:hypothetical protein
MSHQFSRGSERAMLTEEDFRKLVAGEVILVETTRYNKVELALKDIGFLAMQIAIHDAVAKTHDPTKIR